MPVAIATALSALARRIRLKSRIMKRTEDREARGAPAREWTSGIVPMNSTSPVAPLRSRRR
jgi:hypothetical protein